MPVVRRSVLIAGGTLLLLFPALFDLFPSLTGLSPTVRVAGLVGWILLAGVVTYQATRQSENVDQLVDAQSEQLREEREALGLRALSLLLTYPAGALSPFEARLYVWNDEVGKLEPIAKANQSTSLEPSGQVWDPGQGAVGAAWTRGETVVGRGVDCSNDRFHLPPELQRKYRKYRLVSAMPVLNDVDRQIAVLTYSSKDPVHEASFAPDSPEDAAQASATSHIARVMVDLLGWETDE